MIVTTYVGDPLGYEAITPSSVTKFTRSQLHPVSGLARGMQAKAAYISVEDADINFTQHGVNATTSVGHALATGESLLIVGAVALNQFTMIDQAGAATVKVTYYF